MFVLMSAHQQLQHSHQHESLAILGQFSSFFVLIFYFLSLPLLFLCREDNLRNEEFP